MKWIFYLLLLGNAVLFAWGQLYPRYQGEAGVLERQLNAERIRVLPPGAATAAPPAPAAPAVQACLEWGSFAGPAVARAEQALAALALGDRLAQRRGEEASGWWVYIPPQRSKAEAERKSAELKGLGLDDHYVIGDEGPWKYAVSLGVFRTEEAARAHLTRLQGRGVRSAVAGARPAPTERVTFIVREPTAAEQQKLVELQRQFEGSELRAEPCG